MFARKLLAAGAHLGHGRSRGNPKMRPYLRLEKGSAQIIDIRKTIQGLVRAYDFLRKISARRKVVLFVGTKRQVRAVIEREAQRCGMPYVRDRWLGGTLTNYDTIRKRLKRLHDIEEGEREGTLDRRSKKEQSSIRREKKKLLRNLDGLRAMTCLPACLVIVDPHRESIAVAEARRIGAATVALVDTDGDPDDIDLVIPSNDDSMKVVSMIVGALADAILDGKPGSGGRGNPLAGPRPRGDGPDPAGVPARLRPRPAPGRAAAKRDLD